MIINYQSPLLLFFSEVHNDNFLIPLGISFYTFQSMSYSIDVYRGKIKVADSFFQFFAYVSFFPQLVAGPIVRAKQFLPQLKSEASLNWSKFHAGLEKFLLGLFLKLVLADNLARQVNVAFDAKIIIPNSFYWIYKTTAFAIQIYSDFAGYSLMAIGLALMSGFKINENFYYPFTATSIRNFWQRWHISLTEWFRDYVYYPLLGLSHDGLTNKWRISLTIIVTFYLSGLWHGLAMNFILWGLFHGLLLSLEVLTQWDRYLIKAPGGKYLCWLVTMILVMVSMLIFRSNSPVQAYNIFIQMIKFEGSMQHFIIPQIHQVILFAFFIGNVFILSFKRQVDRVAQYSFIRIIFFIILVPVIIFFRGPANNYVYFNF
jgi:alginate O-acetyltransferase complex protein AlgI